MISSQRVVSLMVCLGAVLTSSTLWADFIPIAQPSSSYLGSTTVAGFSEPDGTLIGASEASGVLLTYNNPLTLYTVPTDWFTWGQPPAVESATPRVGYTDGQSSLSISFSTAVSTFGVEVEPGNQIAELTNVTFMSGLTPVGTITLAPNGDGGALLFAASSSTNFFTSVLITNTESDDFAIAEQRFVAAAPEPATLSFFGVALIGGLLGLRKRKPIR